ncbi:MAG: aminomethyl-transferring glycine dehydrogenase subunit GcvPA [Oscillospiraceae bacterium]|jgi:glycine dehydrogenase subunit 1|nr:aminomethyl-transferring glycine dehydrogenase subunit GcvPA [Oscillospiraceae bacterium]
MSNYIPNPDAVQMDMLRVIGLSGMNGLFADIPEALRSGPLDLPDGMSELGVRRAVSTMAARNTVFPTIFRGAGAYRHYIPAIVKTVVSKETFLTAYTPYQAEVSQGVLQAIFEYQSEICMLTSMAASNASAYDGASAAAEAAAMCRDRKRKRTLIAASLNPETIATVETYSRAAGAPVSILPVQNGTLDIDALRGMIGADVSSVIVQSPNYYGLIEDWTIISEICHAAGAKLIVACNPIALALYKTPGECGADIAVGEGQPLGMPLGFGGPYLGFMACVKGLTRQLPGRIAGLTVDADGRRCFVLTLQAREQHIRREKASSSICSNEALCALTATAHLAAMGPRGLRQTAEQCYAKAHYAASALASAGFTIKHDAPFFNEFLTECPVDADKLERRLETEGMLGGLPVDGGILWCVTEMNTRDEIDRLAAVCEEVRRHG